MIAAVSVAFAVAVIVGVAMYQVAKIERRWR